MDRPTPTPCAKGNLAVLLQQMGELAEARRLSEEVVAGQTAQLGPLHLDTLETKHNLACMLQRRLRTLPEPGHCSRRRRRA